MAIPTVGRINEAKSIDNLDDIDRDLQHILSFHHDTRISDIASIYTAINMYHAFIIGENLALYLEKLQQEQSKLHLLVRNGSEIQAVKTRITKLWAGMRKSRCLKVGKVVTVLGVFCLSLRGIPWSFLYHLTDSEFAEWFLFLNANNAQVTNMQLTIKNKMPS